MTPSTHLADVCKKRPHTSPARPGKRPCHRTRRRRQPAERQHQHQHAHAPAHPVDAERLGAVTTMLLTRLRLAAYKVQHGWELCSWEDIAALVQLPSYDDAHTRANAAASRASPRGLPFVRHSGACPPSPACKACTPAHTPRHTRSCSLIAPLGTTPALVIAGLSTPPASPRDAPSAPAPDRPPRVSPTRSPSPASPGLYGVESPPTPTPLAAPKRGARRGDWTRSSLPRMSASLGTATAPSVLDSVSGAPPSALPGLNPLVRTGPKSYEDFWHRLSSATALRAQPPLRRSTPAPPHDRTRPSPTPSLIPRPHD